MKGLPSWPFCMWSWMRVYIMRSSTDTLEDFMCLRRALAVFLGVSVYISSTSFYGWVSGDGEEELLNGVFRNDVLS